MKPQFWNLHTYVDGSSAIIADDGTVVTPIRPRSGVDHDIPNFRLMASAPRLAHALRLFMEQYHIPGDADREARPEIVAGLEALKQAFPHETKAVAYCYDTSPLACRYNRGDGFYFVVIGTLLKHEPVGGESSLTNPDNRFASIDAAEAFADKLPNPWSDFYIELAFPGSKFKKSKHEP